MFKIGKGIVLPEKIPDIKAKKELIIWGLSGRERKLV